MIEGKNVGAADVARAASQIVHGTEAAPVVYVRRRTGDPPRAFLSYVHTNLLSFSFLLHILQEAALDPRLTARRIH